jgi:hypothetical protein
MLLFAALAFVVFGRWFSTALGLLGVAALLVPLVAAPRWPERAAWLLAVVVAAAYVAGSLARPGRLSASLARPLGACDEARRRLSRWDTDGRLSAALAKELEAVRPVLRPVLCRLIDENLAAKESLPAAAVVDLERRVLGFERFRLETMLSSGVTPKRYFGFLDQAGDTAAYETALRDTVQTAVALLNQDADARGVPVRVTEQETTLTFLAEGGALVLSERQEDLDHIHPVNGIGLDNFKQGFARHRTLVTTLDKRLGTGLGALTWTVGSAKVLRRPMTFTEAVAGTALMYLDEKERAAGLLHDRDGSRLDMLSLDRQFVITSLVYNSGILFSDERVEQILAFSMADYLVAASEANRGSRPLLPVWPPAAAETRLVSGAGMPTQLTSWNAVYHVLQRYGAWVALRRFSSFFDQYGRFR